MMYDCLLFFLLISICITFINTDDKNLSETIKNLDQLHDLVKLTTESGDLTSEDFQWWATFPDKSDLELFVGNKCQIPLLRKCNYKVKMFIGIIWNGSLSTNDMIDIRKRVLQYILDCDLKHMITIQSSSFFNNYIQDSLKDYYEKSPNPTAINVAYIFTNYPNETSPNDSDLKLMEEMSNLTSIIQEQQISTHIVHYTDRGVLVMTYNIEGSGKFIIDNQFKCRELGFNTRKNGTFCDQDMAEVMNPCKNSQRHYSVVVPALDEMTNLDESLNRIVNVTLLSCNKVQSTNKFVLVRTDDYEEFICQDKDSCQNMWLLSKLGSNRIAPRWTNWPDLYNNYSYKEDVLFYLTIALTRGYNYGLYSLYIFTNKICSKSDEQLQDVYSGLLQKEFFDELQSLLGELNLDANWVSLYDHSTYSTCDPSMVAPEQENFQFYHLPLNATTEDIESLIVCPTTPPSEIVVPITGLEDAFESTMISDSSTTSSIPSTNNIANTSPSTSEETEPTSEKTTESDNKHLWLLFILIPILIITIAIIIILCLCSTNRYVEKFLWPLNRLRKLESHLTSDRTNFVRWCEIQPKHVGIYRSEKLGEGAFSAVFKGTLSMKEPVKRVIRYDNMKLSFYSPQGEEKYIDVAIKVFHKEISPLQKVVVMDPWREIRLIKRIRYHPFIVNMIGWTRMPFDGPCLLLEYCANGNLLNFLLRLRPLIKDDTLPTAPYENCLSIKDLIVRAWQISDAMVYLTDQNFVHRDLAARNILLTDKIIAKVADFGLCRSTTDTPYVMKGGMMPLKWMAIEALRMLGFSEKTDVWSYGVLLYEMFSIGQQPYACIEMSRGHKFTQQELLVFLQSGGRLEKPVLCPENLYTLMESCWKEDPVERSSFKQIRESLLKMLEEPDEAYGYVQIQEDENFRTEYVHIIK